MRDATDGRLRLAASDDIGPDGSGVAASRQPAERRTATAGRPSAGSTARPPRDCPDPRTPHPSVARSADAPRLRPVRTAPVLGAGRSAAAPRRRRRRRRGGRGMVTAASRGGRPGDPRADGGRDRRCGHGSAPRPAPAAPRSAAGASSDGGRLGGGRRGGGGRARRGPDGRDPPDDGHGRSDPTARRRKGRRHRTRGGPARGRRRRHRGKPDGLAAARGRGRRRRRTPSAITRPHSRGGGRRPRDPARGSRRRRRLVRAAGTASSAGRLRRTGPRPAPRRSRHGPSTGRMHRRPSTGGRDAGGRLTGRADADPRAGNRAVGDRGPAAAVRLTESPVRKVGPDPRPAHWRTPPGTRRGRSGVSPLRTCTRARDLRNARRNRARSGPRRAAPPIGVVTHPRDLAARRDRRVPAPGGSSTAGDPGGDHRRRRSGVDHHRRAPPLADRARGRGDRTPPRAPGHDPRRRIPIVLRRRARADRRRRSHAATMVRGTPAGVRHLGRGLPGPDGRCPRGEQRRLARVRTARAASLRLREPVGDPPRTRRRSPRLGGADRGLRDGRDRRARCVAARALVGCFGAGARRRDRRRIPRRPRRSRGSPPAGHDRDASAAGGVGVGGGRGDHRATGQGRHPGGTERAREPTIDAAPVRPLRRDAVHRDRVARAPRASAGGVAGDADRRRDRARGDGRARAHPRPHERAPRRPMDGLGRPRSTRSRGEPCRPARSGSRCVAGRPDRRPARLETGARRRPPAARGAHPHSIDGRRRRRRRGPRHEPRCPVDRRSPPDHSRRSHGGAACAAIRRIA